MESRDDQLVSRDLMTGLELTAREWFEMIRMLGPAYGARPWGEDVELIPEWDSARGAPFWQRVGNRHPEDIQAPHCVVIRGIEPGFRVTAQHLREYVPAVRAKLMTRLRRRSDWDDPRG